MFVWFIYLEIDAQSIETSSFIQESVTLSKEVSTIINSIYFCIIYQICSCELRLL